MDLDDDDAGGGSDHDSFNDSGGFSEEEEESGLNQSMESKKQEFAVMGAEQLMQEMTASVRDFAGLTGLPEDTASMLLRYLRWNKEDLMGRFFEDRNKLLQEAGLENYDVAPTPVTGTIHCGICDEDVPAADSFAIQCNHRFCRGCWKDYLDDKIKQVKLAIRTRCPMFKCPLVVPDSAVKQLVPPDLFKAYMSAVLRSFVEDNRRMRWCPAPGCEKAVMAFGVTNVKCSCGQKFCFSCNEEAHAPCSCVELQTWLDKCRNESETAHWIIVNTKKCPKCMVRIEKNQGCNHMTCRSCKLEFCWVCLGSWAEHGNHTGGFYKCNKYDPKKKKAATGAATGPVKPADKAEEAKAELDRYLHYYTRYHNHDQSKNYAAKVLADCEHRMQELQTKEGRGATWIDVQFLRNAVELVFECRRVLKYTYVFAYYLEDGSEKELFEFLQQDLERSTEQLSELSEKPPGEIQRSEVANLTYTTEKFMKNLLEGVDRGLTAAVPMKHK